MNNKQEIHLREIRAHALLPSVHHHLSREPGPTGVWAFRLMTIDYRPKLSKYKASVTVDFFK